MNIYKVKTISKSTTMATFPSIPIYVVSDSLETVVKYYKLRSIEEIYSIECIQPNVKILEKNVDK